MPITNRLGIHHLRHHPDDARDFAHFDKIRPASYKPFEWMWNNRDFCAALLKHLPADCLILARDHPMSEQKDDIWRDPEGTGKRHADEWEAKIKGGAYHLPLERSYFLGVNELDAVEGDRKAQDIYWVSFLNRLTQHGRKGGAFNFSTGHPRTRNGTNHPDDRKDYAFFEASHQALRRNGGVAIQHIYGSAAQPLVPGHFDALRDCKWQDVPWIIGECGINEHTVTGKDHVGYKVSLRPPESYPQWMERLIRGVNDPRIHSWMVFTYDFSHPWSDKDVSGESAASVAAAFERWAWKGLDIATTPTPPPQEPTGGSMWQWPLDSVEFTQYWGVPGGSFRRRTSSTGTATYTAHEGVDLRAAVGTPVRAVADGVVTYVATDKNEAGDIKGYGHYIRIRHGAKPHQWDSFYAHLRELPALRQGARVTKGQVIGYSGNTGNSSGPHLHFEVRLVDESGRWDFDAPGAIYNGCVDPVAFFGALDRAAGGAPAVPFSFRLSEMLSGGR